VLAQQDPLYSQYINNPFVINPAYGGLTQNLNTTVSYRAQWTGFEGAPTTFNANGHISLFGNRMGAGLIVVGDKAGNTSVNEVLGTYSYRIPFGDMTMSFGIQAGFANYKVTDAGVTAFDTNDPLFQGSYTEMTPNFGSGVILTGSNFFLGLSVPRMLKPSLSLSSLSTTLYNQHFYAVGSYVFFLSERFRFRPSALVKVVKGAPLSIDLNASFVILENYQVGVLLRNVNSVGLTLHALVKDSFRFGYVFEVPTGRSANASFTTHELTLGLRLSVLRFHSNLSVLSY
jgi:type IX secretion system PorP/SprF family membrane protein